MGRKNFQVVAFAWLLMGACVKDRPSAVSATSSRPDTGSVYVVCEGIYGSSPDASLYLYKPKVDSVFGDVFEAINHRLLGNVFQSMARSDNQYLLVVNNSDQIVFVDSRTLQQTGVVSIRQPRYVLPINEHKAYVSAMYNNKVYVIDPAVMQVTDSIRLPFINSEGMVQDGDAAYVCSWDSSCSAIYKINISNNALADSIRINGRAPETVLSDKDQNLWVLSGNQPDGIPSRLTCVDPSTGDILKQYVFPLDADRLKPTFNSARDTLYFIEASYSFTAANSGIYRMSIYADAPPSGPFIPAGKDQYFYALGIDPLDGNIYVGDPKGFTQKGAAFVYNAAGTLMRQFKTGIGPAQFYFDTP